MKPQTANANDDGILGFMISLVRFLGLHELQVGLAIYVRAAQTFCAGSSYSSVVLQSSDKETQEKLSTYDEKTLVTLVANGKLKISQKFFWNLPRIASLPLTDSPIQSTISPLFPRTDFAVMVAALEAS